MRSPAWQGRSKRTALCCAAGACGPLSLRTEPVCASKARVLTLLVAIRAPPVLGVLGVLGVFLEIRWPVLSSRGPPLSRQQHRRIRRVSGSTLARSPGSDPEKIFDVSDGSSPLVRWMSALTRACGRQRGRGRAADAAEMVTMLLSSPCECAGDTARTARTAFAAAESTAAAGAVPPTCGGFPVVSSLRVTARGACATYARHRCGTHACVNAAVPRVAGACGRDLEGVGGRGNGVGI